jgi:hypothetical protein
MEHDFFAPLMGTLGQFHTVGRKWENCECEIPTKIGGAFSEGEVVTNIVNDDPQLSLRE